MPMPNLPARGPNPRGSNVAERLRALLDRPLDPALARAVVLLALAVGTGFATLFLLGAVGRDGPYVPAATVADRPTTTTPVESRTAPADEGAGEDRHRAVAGQDRQDRKGTEAHGRARRESVRRRALQHVPYRQGDVTIALVGARGPRAILSVRARTLAAARRGYLGFLHRFEDPGTAYRPIFGRRRPSTRPAR